MASMLEVMKDTGLTFDEAENALEELVSMDWMEALVCEDGTFDYVTTAIGQIC